MKQIIFSTGNNEKFLTAKHVCDKAGIELLQSTLDVTEIQEEDAEKVARDKATKAYALVKKPVVISDDSWAFSGLNGFPGVYMHSINKWFTAEDFIRLTKDLDNREAILTQYLVYDDGKQQKVFVNQSKAELLKVARGKSQHANHRIITMEGDDGLSVAEAYDQAEDKSSRQAAKIWHDFCEWFKAQAK